MASIMCTRRGARGGGLPDEPLTWGGGVRGWPRLRAIGGGVAIESPLSARNGSSIDDRDDMFEKCTLVSRRTHTRNRGLLHGEPLLCGRITTVVDEKAWRPVFLGDYNDRAGPFTGTWSDDLGFRHPVDLVTDHVPGMVTHAVRLLPYRFGPGLNLHTVDGGVDGPERPVQHTYACRRMSAWTSESSRSGTPERST